MEHRWGRRVAIGGRLRLLGASGGAVGGRLRNLSISGAFIETQLSVPPSDRVIVEWEMEWYGRAESRGIAAYVVRCEPSGIGVEWCEVAPEWIVAILADAPDRAQALRARSRHSPELRV